ncbi:MFS transporter [uncultured Sphingomonas sp.]|uniref:MFS transporter n=1 Tax=uncultured Sphingomonas sp. TaxID=158754 RepID=UPI0035CB8320
MNVALPVPPRRDLRQGTVVAYGFGAVAYGVKDAGFGTFLLLFYNQVVGLPAATVGIVIAAALIIDAFVDPAVGFLSDRTRSRWGRRHPWMYASALPIMIGYVLLWRPPAGETAALAWLFGCAVLVRTAVSAYEVPSVALTAELTSDYDERTRILAWRYLWGWGGGLTMGLAAWLYFLAPAPGYPNGMLNRDGYAGYAVAGALLMGTAILVSAIGTHREIPYLPRPVIEKQTLRESFGELGEAFRNRAFLILMLASLCVYVNQGVSYALGTYLQGYVWGFRPSDFVVVTVSYLLAAFAAFVFAPRLGKHGDKSRTAAIVVLIGAAIITFPYWLRMAGLAPASGDPLAVPFVIACAVAGTAFNITGFILGASMMADVVEDSEVRTGRRQEGVFFAGAFFVQKCTSGIGIFIAGSILTAAGLSAKATPGSVPEATLASLSTFYAVGYLMLAVLGAYVFTRFPFGRAEHEARLATLAEGGSSAR